MNSAPTQGQEPHKKEHLRFQRTCQMLHKSNARVYKLKKCGNQTLWVDSALVAQWLRHSFVIRIWRAPDKSDKHKLTDTADVPTMHDVPESSTRTKTCRSINTNASMDGLQKSSDEFWPEKGGHSPNLFSGLFVHKGGSPLICYRESQMTWRLIYLEE